MFFSGFYIYYNTNVINSYQNSDERNADLAEYEKTLKKYQFLPQPKIIDVNMKVDIYPSDRDYEAEGYYILENQENQPIKEIHLQLNGNSQFSYEYVRFDVESMVKENYEDMDYVIYELDRPLSPGEKIKLEFKTVFETKGFVEGGSNTGVVFNGSFFNSFDFPTLGYNENAELADDDDRKDNDLEPKQRLMERDDPRGLSMGMLGDDSRGIDFEIVISTEADQIAIAPGYLQREWEQKRTEILPL